ncbi:ABC transporter permease [Candidatus Methanodesulfokora washburnensis]|jgi:peptide/nickel transport system permease protein|nr:ABC transporter permease [Candidatus Methanodesulfokores washburnensis]
MSRRTGRELFLMDVRYSLWLISRNKLVVSGFVLVAFFIFLAIFGPLIVNPEIAQRVDYPNQLKPPSWQHPFGTDDIGRDLLSLIILGARYDLMIAIVVIASSLLIGIVLGSISGYFGGVIDEAMMRITDIFLAFPGLILAMAIATVLGRSFTNLMLALIVVWWSGYARIMRGQVIAEREKPYVAAAKILSIPSYRIIFRHILPNAIYPMLVVATMDIGGAMLTAAGLSFIGLGPSPFEPEWGQLCSRGATYLFQAPWIMFFPGITILFASLGFNLVGDGLRDVLDPRLRR